YPATLAVSKQLLPVAGKPLCYFPLCTLMEADIKEVCVITAPQASDQFFDLLGDGSRFGMDFTWITQREPKSIAEAFIIAADWIDHDPVALILGDNIFVGIGDILSRAKARLTAIGGAEILAVQVANPTRYGVVTFGARDKVKSVREKPKVTNSRWVVPGLYSFASSVIEIA